MSIRGALLLLVAAPAALAAQGDLARLRIAGSGSQTSTGALRCAPGESASLGLDGTDASLQRVSMEQYEPLVRSSNQQVVLAKRSTYAHLINVICESDGEAWIVAEANGLRAWISVLVGSARSKASPKGPPPASVLAQLGIGDASAVSTPTATTSMPVRAGADSVSVPITVRTSETDRTVTAPTGIERTPARTPITKGEVADTTPTLINAPMRPVTATAGRLPMEITATPLTIVGVHLPPRELTAAPLTIIGTFIGPKVLTAAPLTIIGTWNP